MSRPTGPALAKALVSSFALSFGIVVGGTTLVTQVSRRVVAYRQVRAGLLML